MVSFELQRHILPHISQSGCSVCNQAVCLLSFPASLFLYSGTKSHMKPNIYIMLVSVKGFFLNDVVKQYEEICVWKCCILHACRRTRGLELLLPLVCVCLSVYYLGINKAVWVIAVAKRDRESHIPRKRNKKGLVRFRLLWFWPVSPDRCPSPLLSLPPS